MHKSRPQIALDPVLCCSCTHTLVEHVRLVSERGVLTQVLSDHLHPLHLQPLQLLRTRAECDSSVREESLGITGIYTVVKQDQQYF